EALEKAFSSPFRHANCTRALLVPRITLLIWAFLSTDKNDDQFNDYDFSQNFKALNCGFLEECPTLSKRNR
ncbi:MAG: hypothetical protein UC328_08215, partial [Adlercreutzia sp.]|nr:hypothetical protein [Adlercreutzia sp.]